MTNPLFKVVRSAVEMVRASGPLWTASLIADRVTGVPIPSMWPVRTVSTEALAAQLDAVLRAWGMSEEHTAITVRHMMYADLRGIDSHGCAMLRYYHNGLSAGEWSPTPAIEVVREGETTALVDGGGGLGHVPSDRAMNLAIEKGLASGLGAVAVRDSGHFGAAGAYASMASDRGLIGIVTSSAQAPAVVPTFGAEAMLGTNPLAFAAPAGRNEPFLLDMATSTASLGALTRAWRRGDSIPVGWAIDAGGEPVTDGRVAASHRLLMPLGGSREMGGHKGYGLAAATEILSRILAGSRSAPEAPHRLKRAEHFFLVLDPRRFRDEPDFEADLDGLMDSLRASRPRDPGRPVLVAGDPEHAALAVRRREGIPLARGVVEDLRVVAHEAGAPFLLEA